MRPNGELPSDHYADRRRKTPELRRKAHLTVHPPSACSGVKALRNTSDAKAARRQAPLAFRSLDPFRALREPVRRRRDEERPFPLRTKNWQRNPKNNRLTVLSSCEVCGAKMRPNGELPSDHYADRRRKTPELRRKAHLAVHPPSACSGVKALRNTSDAKAARRQAPLAFRSLDPFRALREPDRRRRDEERPFPLRTKNCEQNPKTTA